MTAASLGKVLLAMYFHPLNHCDLMLLNSLSAGTSVCCHKIGVGSEVEFAGDDGCQPWLMVTFPVSRAEWRIQGAHPAGKWSVSYPPLCPQTFFSEFTAAIYEEHVYLCNLP